MYSEFNEGRPVGPQWIEPSIEEEIGEIERTSEALSVDKEAILKAAENATLEELNEQDWATMINTDSKDVSWKIDEVKDWLKSRTVDGQDETRDIDKLLSGYEMGNRIPAPIVLFRQGEPPYLIAGNSRLLVARAKGDAPKILAVRMDQSAE